MTHASVGLVAPLLDGAPPSVSSLVLDGAHQHLLFLDARSNTTFAERSVPPSLIRDVYDLVKWAPTAGNSSPLRLAIASSDEARAAVITHAKETNRPKLTRAPLLLVVARDERYHDSPHLAALPAEVRATLDADHADRTRRSHDNTLLQSAYLVIGLRAAGLAARPYGGFDKEGLDAALFGETSWRSELLLGVGYPATDDHGAGPRKPRLSAEVATRTF